MIPPPPTSTLFPYTTLFRSCFSDKPYVNLEAVDDREYATEDPRGFLAQFPQGAILDEVQHAPELLSYLQVRSEEHTSELQSRGHLVCRLLLEKKKKQRSSRH